MKSILHFSLIASFMLIFSCTSQEEDNEIISLDFTTQNIIGKWQLTESYVSPGGETEWRSVQDGDVYTFSADGTFTNSDNPNCKEGTFSLDGDNLNLSCGEQDLWYKMNRLSSREMIISGTNCTEPCLYKYKRID